MGLVEERYLSQDSERAGSLPLAKRARQGEGLGQRPYGWQGSKDQQGGQVAGGRQTGSKQLSSA